MFKSLPDLKAPYYSFSLFAKALSQVLYTSRGRESFLTLLQYSAELYKECMKQYAAYNPSDHWANSVQNARSIEHSMSSGRKMIRLFRFLDEVGEIEKLIDATKSWNVAVVLKMLSHACSFLYYVLDNLVLASSIGVISQVVSAFNIRWKSTKDMASLSRCLLEIVLSFLAFRQIRQRTQSASRTLRTGPNRDSLMSSAGSDALSDLLETRQKARVVLVDFVQNGLRLIMLVKALELPGSRRLSPAFVAVIGVLSSSIAVLKRVLSAQTI